ncbi:unnamed protein product [Trichogramma brassicae]|uniref:BTB domain-containing protein n=1 Tax=Trichogramma brassicae TaxID=86971 RepID=A0A6H5ID12_9HYME|nr:unnamed protein product [Trichogramma brassicae]
MLMYNLHWKRSMLIETDQIIELLGIGLTIQLSRPLVEEDEIPAHKIVLSAASPVFRAMFTHDMLENNENSVKITDITEDILTEMLSISLLCPPGWPIRCTRYKYNLVDDFPQASRDVFATLSTQVAFSVHQVLRIPLDTDRPVFELSLVTWVQVLQVIASSKSKAIGPDHLSTVMLKRAAPLIASPLQEIINLSITSHTFPSAWRKTYVLPLSTKKVITDISDMRPIAKLGEMSKLCERLVHNQLMLIAFSSKMSCSAHDRLVFGEGTALRRLCWGSQMMCVRLWMTEK